jgi:hypothetical protein
VVRAQPTLWIGGSEEEIAAWHLLHEEGRVLAAHRPLTGGDVLEKARPDERLGRCVHHLGTPGVVDDRRRQGDDLEFGRGVEAEVVPGTSLSVDTEADTITADFDLDGATPGLGDVRVTNPESQVATLVDGFEVLDASLPDLRVSKTAEESSIDPVPGRLPKLGETDNSVNSDPLIDDVAFG